MAVFTTVAEPAAAALAQALGAGRLQALQPVAAGIENTNYFLTTDQGAWVLTLFERLAPAQLPFYLGLMQHLARHGLPVPEPRADAAGQLLHALAGKPAALCNRLPGETLDAPDLHHCQQLGQVLARMHLAAADFAPQQPNLRGLAWWQATVPRLLPHLGPEQAALLREELAWQQHVAQSPAHAALPRAAVHADLFRDNVVWSGLAGHERLTGCFDFYFAGVDTLAYDLAVCLNDWCVDDSSGRLDDARAQALLRGYRAEREPTAHEQRLLPALLRAAGFRFWLSRLADWHLPRPASLLAPKDPQHFERILRQRIAEPWHP